MQSQDSILHLSRSERGYKHPNALEGWNPNWSELKKALTQCVEGPKDGSHYMRGYCDGTRSQENIAEADIHILDCDSRIDPETGEVLQGAPPYQEVSAALDKLGFAYILHSTFNDGVKGPRYRIILVYSRPIESAELGRIDRWLLAQLHNAGVLLAGNKEQRTWAQLFYFPRLPKDRLRIPMIPATQST